MTLSPHNHHSHHTQPYFQVQSHPQSPTSPHNPQITTTRYLSTLQISQNANQHAHKTPTNRNPPPPSTNNNNNPASPTTPLPKTPPLLRLRLQPLPNPNGPSLQNKPHPLRKTPRNSLPPTLALAHQRSRLRERPPAGWPAYILAT